MEVVQIKNPRALMVPEVMQLLRDATESIHIAAPGGFDSIAVDMYNLVTDDNSFFIIGAEGGHFKSLVLGYFPNSALFPYPTIITFYNKGSPALRRATGAKLLDILLARGYTSAWAVNSSGRSDKAWQHAFEIPGRTKAVPIGTVFELKVI